MTNYKLNPHITAIIFTLFFLMIIIMCKKSLETYTDDGALAWVQHPQGLVLAGGENPGAVPVPAGAVDEVSVHAVDPHRRLPAGHVPQDHHVIAACRDAAVTSVTGKKTQLNGLTGGLGTQQQ